MPERLVVDETCCIVSQLSLGIACITAMQTVGNKQRKYAN